MIQLTILVSSGFKVILSVWHDSSFSEPVCVSASTSKADFNSTEVWTAEWTRNFPAPSLKGAAVSDVTVERASDRLIF